MITVLISEAIRPKAEEIEGRLDTRLAEIRGDIGKPKSNWTQVNLEAAKIFAEWGCCLKQREKHNSSLIKNIICCPPGMLIQVHTLQESFDSVTENKPH